MPRLRPSKEKLLLDAFKVFDTDNSGFASLLQSIEQSTHCG